ncbi:MAG: sulfatase [Verrucomicrobia bacterium]|nr:sulfatase [Verrucomicrobiota bacterium]
MRLPCCRTALVGALTLLTGWPATEAAAAERPNILLIFSDDHSCQSLGAYRTWLTDFIRQQQLTPNLDRLAAQGVVFERSFCANSICSPSRAAVLSGAHAHINGVTRLGGRIREGVWTFPPALQAIGYQTAVIGKWHMAQDPAGFDFWRVLPGQGHYWRPEFRGPSGFREEVAGYATDAITDKSLVWLKQRDPNKPFLLLCHHKAPHRPWNPPARYYRLLADVTVPEPATLFDDYAGRTSSARNQKMEIGRDMTLASDLKVLPPGKYPPRLTPEGEAEWEAAFRGRNEAFAQANLAGRDLTRWKYQEYMKDYLRCIKAVDDGVGRLLEYLEQEGLDRQTIVIYSSDQSFFNGEHGWFDKRWIYEESLTMPLIVRWPGVAQPGRRVGALVQNIDYAPTFLEMAGSRAPSTVQGRSLVPWLRGQSPEDWRRSIYYHYYDPGHGVQRHYGLRTERYTLAHFYPVKEWELFDLERDPQQMRSVYEDPGYAQTVAELKTELARLRQHYGDSDERDQP